jgi:hypothetical protein
LYEVKEPFWQVIDHWQTLIAGMLALAAGVGAVVTTIKSASREVTAAQAQTKAAQYQIAVTREIERRRISREGYSFYAMLEAAMRSVTEDVGEARKMFAAPPPSGSSGAAHEVRQRVKRVGFAELRGAFLRFGGPLTAPFLYLDKEIEDFAAQWMNVPSATGLEPTREGINTRLHEQLGRIEQQAIILRQKAADGMKFCRDELAKELVTEADATLEPP